MVFFIRYTPEDIFKERWLLVQINYDEISLLKMNPETTGDYHVNFLARHPNDTRLCDDKDRWWPEWHEYKLDSDNIPVYGARVLFSSKRKPDLKNICYGPTLYLLQTLIILFTGHSIMMLILMPYKLNNMLL